MIKGYRWGAAAGVAALLGFAVVAYAQMAPAQITARQEAMKGQGAAARTLTLMVRGEQPWNQQAAVAALTTINGTAKKIPDLFKENVAAPAGVKNDALPVVWTNKADFDAKAKALEEASGKVLAVAQAGNEAEFKAQMPTIGRSCGGCHETYRVKQN
jgi:cytochrome c556